MFHVSCGKCNMWFKCALLFLVLVGATVSLANRAWKENTEYVYNVRGRTLASLHDVSHHYSGILFKAVLRIQPRTYGRLQGYLNDAQYVQIHSQLRDGWNTEIPDADLNWTPFTMASKAFQIELKQGSINNIVVSEAVTNWEANIIKSIVSQFQLNINDKENENVFLTMEDTVTGNTETLYKINPLPDYIVQSMSNGKYLLEQKGDGQVIEVVKHKNYSNSIELPSYFHGFGGLETGFPATNKMGNFFIRNSLSHIILTGNLKEYTIQSSSTVNEIIISPTLRDSQRGGVFSQMNVTLQVTKPKEHVIQDVVNPVHLGNLVYSYAKSSSQNNYIHEKTPYQNIDSEENYKNQQPEIQEVPDVPLLPYTMGYQGMPVKRKIEIVAIVTHLAQEIGRDLQDEEQILQEDTLNKFTMLSSLLRTMNIQEMKRASAQLYNSSEDGSRRDAWNAFRDGVAECGTGPALLVIKDWIESNNITATEASLILATAAKATRQPTLQYMKTFFDLIQSSKVQSQWPLNDTALLSYSNLARDVYVVKKVSKKQYPSKSFTSFDTEDGQSFLEHSVIGYYSMELHKAISQGKPHRIHVFIRSLGNIAHPSILTAFEPYLEGSKQASQFQRLLMVVAMDRLSQYFADEVRSALFRIYQNTGESEEVRVAAVYQLMRTHPDAEILQFMAAYTNIDKHEYVNAAVKSSIESISELGTENPKLIPLRIASRQARPLLTDRVYGIQYGANYLRTRFIEELGVTYKESAQIIGGFDHYIPKGLKYSLRSYLGSINHRILSFQAMVSSVNELVDVFEKQTEHYSKQQQQQKSSYERQKENPWAGPNIAKLLNMQSEELEQLEGNLYLEIAHPYGMVSFDNTTIGLLPEKISNLEDEYRNGKKIATVKMINQREMALSFPTETGLPFVFTYDTPVIINVKGFVKASASPQISRNNKIHIPDSVQLRSDLNVLFTRKVQSRISFLTPFDNQQYIAGFDSQGQIHVPIQGNCLVDLKKMKIEIELVPPASKKTLLYHYSTRPYTSRADVTIFKPVVNQPNTNTLSEEDIQKFDAVWGTKETGLAFHVQFQHKTSFFNYLYLKDLFLNYGSTRSLDDSDILYSQINVTLLPQESTTEKVIIRLGYQHEYRFSGPERERVFTVAEDPMRRQRQQTILEKVSSGIRNVEIDAIEAEIKFQGESFTKHTVTAAVGKSYTDTKSRLLVKYQKSSANQDIEPYTIDLDVKNDFPIGDTLDLDYSMQNAPEGKSQAQLIFGRTDDYFASKIQAQFNFKRSEERKKYLTLQANYKQCKSEMVLGDKQLSACANLTKEANFLDTIDGRIEYQNLKPCLKNILKSLYDSWRFHHFSFVNTEYKQSSISNLILMQAQFDPDLKAVNVTINDEEESTTITNIKINDDLKTLVIFHPEFNLLSKLRNDVLKLPQYGPFCVVDKTRMSTFSNYSFQVDISNYWTLMFQYIPKVKHQMTLEEQLKYQTEHYAVLIRSSKGQNRDVKITISSAETEFKIFDITMVPQQVDSSFEAKVIVDGEDVELNEKQNYVYQNGYIQIYRLPNGELKFEVKDGFSVVYDGMRVRLDVTASKFKSAVRGICGQYSAERTEDLDTPIDCITSDPHKFVKSYEIGSLEGQRLRQQFSDKSNVECVRKSLPLYVDVVTNESQGASRFSDHCNLLQTRYVELGEEICFTLEALPKCKAGCQSHRLITRDVSVHCVQQSNVAQLWKDQIDKGGNPDFSHKRLSRIISFEVPQGCTE